MIPLQPIPCTGGSPPGAPGHRSGQRWHMNEHPKSLVFAKIAVTPEQMQP